MGPPDPSLTLETESAQLRELLSVARKRFGLSLGIISHIEGEHYTVEHALSGDGSDLVGSRFPLGETYCAITFEANAPVAISHMGQSEYSGHPCYHAFNLESYIGIPVVVNGQRYGTLNFSSTEPREVPFDAGDLEFMRFLGRMVSGIKHRAAIEELLRRREEILRLALEASRTGVWEYDPARDELVWDDTIREIHGLPVGMNQSDQKSFLAVVHSDDRGLVVEQADAALAGRPYECEYRVVRPDTSVRWVVSRGELLSAGDKVRLIGTIRDVQRRKTMQAELERQLAEIQELERLRDGLTLMIVHDMRSPLTGIISALDLLREDPNLDEEGRQDVALALEGGSRLAAMVNEILDMSRLESSEFPLDKQRHRVVDLVDAALASLGALTRNRTVERQVAADLYMVCDGALTERVVANLFGNALKFTPKDGRITITAQEQDQSMRISVKDTGPGIPPESLARVFEKFGQVDPKRSRSSSTGLGLAFCKLAVEEHGGQIGVESIVGEGSTFWFSIPHAG